MRDLKTGDRIINGGRPLVESVDGTCEPLCWNGLKDWARWWIRQAELNADLCISTQQRSVFMAILNDEQVT